MAYIKVKPEVPALLKSRIATEDQVSVSLSPGMKTAYMVLSEFEQELGAVTTKIFPTESTAKSYAQGQEVIKVDVIRKFE